MEIDLNNFIKKVEQPILIKLPQNNNNNELPETKNIYLSLLEKELPEIKYLYKLLSDYHKNQFLLWLIDTQPCINWKEILKCLITSLFE